MTREELIEKCKYYKGEKECPFEEKSDAAAFWFYEKMFATTGNTDDRIDIYTRRVQRYIDSHPQEKNPLTSAEVDVITKCIILYTEDMLRKWNPRNVDLIFHY